ncbi:ACP S-malonyltransferase [Megalodesulfovibrio gigas]|uniref:Malonyl CoA-acyl carrier protein transacylase n=1 Tax=Megalodesulfovibrio gigas (strain ATCC 19364 / DSM 1382 / NCIMB 9332 / VKM B-1759) TaxID=1121448 RepID=T2GBY2_MEGG1|nr:ACP S-malonyltransferase [Megalodesulfovibrio gigas]AGW14070.1 putative (Acyl-carrier-protein) S-malonyltransferase [Megalodesulfovibrio gigas DSM 1382 = ATCC 19364]
MTSPATALLFPGQGSQEPGMGRDLADADAAIMDLWKRAEKISGLPLREIYWEGDDTAQADTRSLQPALTVVNLSIFLSLAEKFMALSPLPCVAGHSLGEFSALAASQALAVDDVLELVALRGRLMAEADPAGKGGMAAVVKLPREAVEEMVSTTRESLGKELLVANYNSPAQYVVSGEKAAVEALAPLAKERKGRLLMLAVSGAFHSPLMAEANKELAGVMQKRTWNTPKLPVFSNVTGGKITDADGIKAAMLQQMVSPVRWIELVQAMWDDGRRRFLELGPKNVLAKLVQGNLTADAASYEIHSLGKRDAVASLTL